MNMRIISNVNNNDDTFMTTDQTKQQEALRLKINKAKAQNNYDDKNTATC